MSQPATTIPLIDGHPPWCAHTQCAMTISDTIHLSPVTRFRCGDAAFAMSLRRSVEHDFPAEAETSAVLNVRDAAWADPVPEVEVWLPAAQARIVARQLLAFADLADLDSGRIQ
jgi:hypothetical protein